MVFPFTFPAMSRYNCSFFCDFLSSFFLRCDFNVFYLFFSVSIFSFDLCVFCHLWAFVFKSKSCCYSMKRRGKKNYYVIVNMRWKIEVKASLLQFYPTAKWKNDSFVFAFAIFFSIQKYKFACFLGWYIYSMGGQRGR